MNAAHITPRPRRRARWQLFRRLLCWWTACRAQTAREEAELHDAIGDINRSTAAYLRAKSDRLAQRARMIELEL